MLGAGVTVALPFTPVPWKLLDDSAIWTQNWPWIPTPARGEASTKYTACTLCPAACGLKTRCIADKPVGIAPVAQHPINGGGLCALVYGAHQLPWHPLRLTQPSLNGADVSMDQLQAAVSDRLNKRAGTVAMLDARPGRVASRLCAKLLSKYEGSLYLTARRPGDGASRWLARWSGSPDPLGIDLENASTIVSLGVPVLDGWGTPGRVLSLWKQRRFRLIQIEEQQSTTAALADRWISAKPDVSTLPALLGESWAQLAAAGPVIVLGDDPQVAALNGQLGNVGRSGGFVARRALPLAAGETLTPATLLDDVPAHSVDVLFIDGEAAPWSQIEAKLKPGAMVVSFSAYRAGSALKAQAVVPAPVFQETLDDVTAPFDARVASFSLAPALLPTPAVTRTPQDFLARVINGGESGYEDAVLAQVTAIYAAKRGSVFVFSEASSKPVTDFESAAKLRDQLLAGAVWTDDAATTPLRCTVPSTLPAAYGNPGANWTTAVLPPLATKLYQESTLKTTREI
jgi:anaerobic selenocysteine-containing dehydrogenase